MKVYTFWCRIFWRKIRRHRTRNFKMVVASIFFVTIFIFIHNYFYPRVRKKNRILPSSHNISFFVPYSLKKQDWHNYTQITLESKRNGIEEKGRPVNTSEAELSTVIRLTDIGYNAAISDMISLDRSLPDTRHPECKNRLYLKSLPPVSIILPVFNEHWTALLRTLHTVLKRTPEHLIKEIFIVDDASTKDFLKDKLDNYVKEHMPSKVKIIRLKERAGLVTARLAGAIMATADVLVFLDAHTEANVNWLPPLLEPIAFNYRVVVCPLLDIIDHDNFEYHVQDDGMRGVFDWNLMYQRLPLLPKDLKNLPEPYASPVMAGGFFAISRKFFWELGGYDQGLKIWGAEQFELSFKIWQCGGRLLEAPCSRVGHIYKKCAPIDMNLFGDFISKNKKRVVEVWMDEYAEYIYTNLFWLPHVDAGDLFEQQALRKKLKCKPFKWFMTQIAFDMQQIYPAVEPKPYAEGQVRPLINPLMCVDAHGCDQLANLKLTLCRSGDEEQIFALTWYKSMRVQSRNLCWDVTGADPQNPIVLYNCHRNQGNQYWKYDVATKQFIHYSQFCLEHDLTNHQLFLGWCDQSLLSQKWEVEVDRQRMEKWDQDTVPVTGPVEEWKE